MNAPRHFLHIKSSTLAWRTLGMALLIVQQATMLLQAAGTVVAWGANDASQCQVPSGLSNVVAVAGGQSHSLALRADGIVFGWGFNLSGQATVPPGLSNVAGITAGGSFSAAVTSNGTVVVWGSLAPKPASVTNVTALAAGQNHCLALKADGTVVSWGSSTNVPPGLTGVVSIAAGNEYSLALRNDGTVAVWGTNSYTITTNMPVLTNILAIAAGGDHGLAIRKDLSVLAWGRNDRGQATIPPVLTNAIAVSGGALHSVALRPDGTILAWGDNTYNQTVINSTVPGFVAIGAGGYHSLAIKGDNFPVILLQPLSQSVYLTKSVKLQVVAAGAPPLAYQWMQYDTNLFRATNSSLTITNFTMTNSGPYKVTVANSYGSVVSSPAILSAIGGAPVAQPLGFLTNDCGDNVMFQVTVDGSGPFGYLWRFNTTPIPGATNASLTLSNVTTANTGSYGVDVTNAFGSSSSSGYLTVLATPPLITSALTASGKQGTPFTYRITALHAPQRFGARDLPSGLTINTTNGVISGTPTDTGKFGSTILAYNACASDSQVLVLTITSSVPVITAPTLVSGTEGAPLTANITATQSPKLFGGLDLPVGVTVDAITGGIAGTPIYAGDFYSTVWASNQWGIGSAQVHFAIANAAVAGLGLESVSSVYSKPYLLDYFFTLRDSPNPTSASVVTQPRLLSATCYEDGIEISPSETGIILAAGANKTFKSYLVLDFSDSIASTIINGDTNSDGISDAVDNMVSGAEYFVSQQDVTAQVGVYEFHREDVDPAKVVGLTSDKTLLNSSIAGIWTNYVNYFSAGSRCWDAVVAAIGAVASTNRDDQCNVIFVSDGQDESSTNTVDDVITAATNASVRVYAIGFGTTMNTANLDAITSQTGGRLYIAANPGELSQKFAALSKDMKGQYILRWATLKRSAKSFKPSFVIHYQGFDAASPDDIIIPPVTNVDDTVDPPVTNVTPGQTNVFIPAYTPTSNAGPVIVGSLRLVADAEVLPTGVTLRASYVPRYIRQIRLHYRPNWPCTSVIQSTNIGEILNGWSMMETNDGTGGKWLLLSSPNPTNVNTSIPFAAFGRLVTFKFQDVITTSNAFSLFDVDNSIYSNIIAGGQSFVFEDTNAFVVTYPVLPHGTPVPWLIANGFPGNWPIAENTDPDTDGMKNWQEYRANTNPNDINSRLLISSMVRLANGRSQIVFTAMTNRVYRVEASVDFVNWQVVQDKIAGNNADITVTDTRYVPAAATNQYYRVMVY